MSASPLAPASIFRPRTVLVTGGAGFIGSAFVRWLLAHERDVRVVNLDLLTYAADREALAALTAAHGAAADGRHYFVHGDVRDDALDAALLAGAGVENDTGRAIPAADAIVHLAAETHVDRSILGPKAFVETNVAGTLALLEATRTELAARPRPFRFVHVSTDEVYGSLAPDERAFTEESPLRPNSPYSASKAGADCLVRAYRETFALPCLTTRCSNNYGPRQFPEKLIPLAITHALDDRPIPLYGDGRQVRDWLHVDDHAAALWAVCTRGRLEDGVYNVGGGTEAPNVEIVGQLLALLGKPASLIAHVTDRPGHDRRYAIDSARLRAATGWAPAHTLARGLAETVAWYRAHEGWWRAVQDEAYRASRALYTATPRP